MEIDEIKEAIDRCECEDCSLREVCDLYELFKGETICRAVVDRAEEF